MEIPIDYVDYQTINSHYGYSVGFNSDILEVKSLEVELLQRFEKQFAKSKGVLIKFVANENYSMFGIASALAKINSMTDDNSEVIIGLETNNSIKLEECKFEVIITGLETTD